MQSSCVQSNPGTGTQSRALARARCSAARVHELASKEEAANSSAQGEIRTAHNADLESRCGRNAQRAWQSCGANGVEGARTVAGGRAGEKSGVWEGNGRGLRAEGAAGQEIQCSCYAGRWRTEHKWRMGALYEGALRSVVVLREENWEHRMRGRRRNRRWERNAEVVGDDGGGVAMGKRLRSALWDAQDGIDCGGAASDNGGICTIYLRCGGDEKQSPQRGMVVPERYQVWAGVVSRVGSS
ncbi:hypothetical protein B0H13DRAFT_1930168 [Mycena leptocephala]|nr:hypothetical protein B0H13DRAFT_1930168 [Mycena leptocephala]